MKFSRLDEKDDIFFINSKKIFKGIKFETKNLIKEVYHFTNGMTFNNDGEHRSYRSGGSLSRKNGEIFCNTFQGKLAEFAVYENLKKNNFDTSRPDLKKYKLGIWDTYDLNLKEKNIAIKSAKYFSNLLLLEEKDWDNQANYVPNLDKKKTDIFIFVRIFPDISNTLKKLGIFYSNSIDRDTQEKLFFEIKNIEWSYDIPGFITTKDLMDIINLKFIIFKNKFLNSLKVKIDANNYYIQSGDMREISEISKYLI